MYRQKIVAIRNARGYTQDYMAKKLGIAQNTYSRLEKGIGKRIDEELLSRISDLLGVSIEDLKNPAPIVMNMHDYSQGFNQASIVNNSDEKFIKELISQLDKKDKQIEALLNLLRDKK